VAQVMTTPVVTATEAMPFRDVAALLCARDIGAMSVVAPTGQLLGVVSRPDLIPKVAGWPPHGTVPGVRVAAPGAPPGHGTHHGELMTTPAVTVTPQATVEQAAPHATPPGRAAAVTFPLTGRLAGIVTRSDLLRVYRRPGEEIRAETETEVPHRVRGADPRRLAVSVRDGVVSVSGQVESRPAVARLVTAVLAVEGVVGVDERVGFDLDDRYPPVLVTF